LEWSARVRMEVSMPTCADWRYVDVIARGAIGEVGP